MFEPGVPVATVTPSPANTFAPFAFIVYVVVVVPSEFWTSFLTISFIFVPATTSIDFLAILLITLFPSLLMLLKLLFAASSFVTSTDRS